MVKHSHLVKVVFCVSFLLVSGVAAQGDDTIAPTTTSRPTRPPITFGPITVEPTTTKVPTLKPTTVSPTTTAAKTTVEPTPTVTETESPAPTPTETAAPVTTTTTGPTTTRKTTTAKPTTTNAAIEETSATAAPITTLRTTTMAPAADEGSSIGLYIGLGVGGAVLLAGIVFLLLRLKQARDDDDDDYEEAHTYKVTAPAYTKPAPAVAILNANAPPAKAPQILTQQYNPYTNNNAAPLYQQQRSLQPTNAAPAVGSYLNTTSTHHDSEFEYEGQHSAALAAIPTGGYDTDRESEFASQSFLNDPSGQHTVFEFKDSIDSRDSSLSEDLQISPKRNGRARVSSVEL